MPEISRFYGIVVKMFFDDHPPPYFHAEYSGKSVVVDINTLSIVAGSFPHRAMCLVTESAQLHQDELRDSWRRAENLESPGKINPLA